MMSGEIQKEGDNVRRFLNTNTTEQKSENSLRLLNNTLYCIQVDVLNKVPLDRSIQQNLTDLQKLEIGYTQVARDIKSKLSIILDNDIPHHQKESLKNNHLLKIDKNSSVGDISDYVKWLQGYNKSHNGPHDLENLFISKNISFIIAKDGLELFPLYGDYAVNIIVPSGVSVKIYNNDIGDNKLYYMDGYKHKGALVGMFSGI